MERTTSFTNRLFRRAADVAAIMGGLLSAVHGPMPAAEARHSSNIIGTLCYTCAPAPSLMVT